MKVSSTSSVQAIVKSQTASKRPINTKNNNNNSSNSVTTNSNSTRNPSQCKEIEIRTKLYNRSHLQPLSASASSNGIELKMNEKKPQTHRQPNLIQAKKPNANDLRPLLNDNTTNGKIYSQPQKAINGHHQRDSVRNDYSENTRKKLQMEMKSRVVDNKAVHPFIPSKRIIQHHDYQNIVDDAKMTKTVSAPSAAPLISSPKNRNRYDNCIYDSVANTKGLMDKNNNRKYERTKTPIYRFGDTNLLRKGKNSPSKCNPLNNENNNNNNKDISDNNKSNNGSSLSLAITEPSMASFDKYQKVIKCTQYSDEKHLNVNNQQITQRSDAFPNVSSSYATRNLTNDTGFGSMDTDAASIVTNSKPNKSTKTNHFQLPFQCINYNVKNRIKMFDVKPYRNAINNDKR